jgi:hypothetical protein
MLIISLVAEYLFVSQEIFRSMEFVRGEAENKNNCITRSWIIYEMYYIIIIIIIITLQPFVGP